MRFGWRHLACWVWLPAAACLLWQFCHAPTPPVALGLTVVLVLLLALLRQRAIANDHARTTSAAQRELAERRQAEGQLRAANDVLELRVAERTQELLFTNESLRAEIAEHTRVEDELRVRDFAMASSLNAIALTDMDGRITYVNPAFATMWKYAPAEALGRALVDFWFSRDAALTVLATVRAAGSWDGEVRARRPGGEAFDVQVAASVVRDAEQRPVCLMAAFLDVTLRHRADAALRARLRYEEFLASSAAALLGDSVGGDPLQSVVGQLLQISGAARVCVFENYSHPMEGLSTRQICAAAAPGVDPQTGSTAWRDFPYARGFQRWADEFSRGNSVSACLDDCPASERPMLESRAIVSLRALPLLVGGNWRGLLAFDDTVRERRWAAEDLRLLETAARLIAAYLERRATVAALSQSLTHWQATFDAVVDGICLLDKDQHIQRCNAAFARLVSTPIAACGSRYCWELMHKSDGPITDCPVSRAALSLHRETVELVDGNRVLEVVADPLINPADGSYDGAVHIVRDITARRHAEDERQRLETQVQHARKLESLGVMAGGIAHDFNNILTTILGNADLAMAEVPPDAAVMENLSQIEAAGRRAAELCRQLLAYSGHGRFMLEQIDLSALLRGLAPQLTQCVSRQATVEYRLADTLPAVEGDASQIRQVVLNLMVNASEALGDGEGLIRVSMHSRFFREADLEAEWTGDHLGEGDYVVMEIADTGCGIEAADLPKIFDPFYSTKFTGRGLGLSAVQGIVRGHGGTLDVESRPGKGTTVRVLLPAVKSPAQTVERLGESVPEPPWRGQGTILVVDDDPTLRVLAERMLLRLGFTVLTAPDGQAGVDLFAGRRAGIACVLLDLTMPRMDGSQAFLEIRKLRGDIPVVLCSGYSESEVAPRFAGLGLAGFLQKPYRLESLAAKLREVLT